MISHIYLVFVFPPARNITLISILKIIKNGSDNFDFGCNFESTSSHEDFSSLESSKINLPSNNSKNLTNDVENFKKDYGSIDNISIVNDSPESIAKLYPHLYSTILQGQTSLLRENANQSLAALFPSVLTAEGLKNKNEAPSPVTTSTNNSSTTVNPTVTSSSVTCSVAAELSQALSTALSLSASEAAAAETVTASYKDKLPRSNTAVTQTNLTNCCTEKDETRARSIVSTTHSNSSSTSINDGLTNSHCTTGKKRKHQQTPATPHCTTAVTLQSTNITMPRSTSSDSTMTVPSAKETRQEIGPATLGDALQQKIRETQAKIKSNVISASSSQSILPPGKCNSHYNHQTGSKELNQLLHQHYCGKKAPKGPSASAVRKGKVPPQPGSANMSPSSAKTPPKTGSDSTVAQNELTDKSKPQTTDFLPEDCDR